MGADRAPRPGPRRQGRSEFVVVRELEPLRASPRGRLVAQILQGDRGRRLDVPEYVAEANYEGFTKRGVHLSAEEFQALLGQGDAILKLLVGGRG
jgi:hypothetical protein